MYRKVQDEITKASEQERLKWMRRRLLAFCLFLAALSVIGVLRDRQLAHRLPDALKAFICVGGYLFVRQRLRRPLDIVRYGFWFIFVTGMLAFFVDPLFQRNLLRRPGGAFGIVMSMHLIASVFLPWSVREAAKVLGLLCLLGITSALVYTKGSWTGFFGLMFLPAAGAPGLLFCWLRHGRLHRRVALKHLTGRYGALKAQLKHARSIHEMLFPSAIQDGPIRMAYAFEPMLDIGGDYLYVRSHPDGPISLIVIDVNGHGIGAALSVNRVYGELERIFGENENLTPDVALSALNHYFFVSLAREGIFATAFCARVDPGFDELAWANAGHPHAFLTDDTRGLRMLESHAVMLGVLDDDDFDCELQKTPWDKNAHLVIYTDGVTEARDREGRTLDIEGFAEIVRKIQRDSHGSPSSGRLLQEVQAYRDGPAMDDTLIVEVHRAP
ncbi:MAG: SpoIIE family protein phosphatase [Vicinamibacteria bacterium]|nr:SpoIIE family protein phosphatase [Vicinamibacteria bacterium]